MSDLHLHPLQIDVLCVGHAAFDLTLMVDHHPGSDEKCSSSFMVACGGGPAANAAVTVTRLGGTSGFAGYLGRDLHGSLHFDELGKERIDRTWIVRGDHPTPLSVILAKPNGHRTVVNHRAKTPFLEPKDVDFSRCSPKAILFDGHEPLISLPLAQSARNRGIPLILDAGSVHGGTIDLLPHMDYVVSSARFARDFTQESDPERAARRLSEVVPFAAVTLGEGGVVWQNREGTGRLPAYAVDAVDTTGAGDAFHGAFALGIARSKEIEALLRFAGATAALTCTRPGARLSIPTWREVYDFLLARSEARAFPPASPQKP